MADRYTSNDKRKSSMTHARYTRTLRVRKGVQRQRRLVQPQEGVLAVPGSPSGAAR